jgi:hypothetical protein
MPVRIAVFAEADADRRLVCGLIDRKLWDHRPEWWHDERRTEELDAARTWCGVEPRTLYTRWSDLRTLRSSRDALRRTGFLGFKGKPAPSPVDGAAARNALVYCAFEMNPPPDAMVLMRDMDQQPEERRESIKSASEQFTTSHTLAVILALPDAKLESWILNGFEPRNRKEKETHVALHQELGFDPCASSERLGAATHGALRDAKRVLRSLTQDDAEREAMCWEATSWTVLRTRGELTSLNAFLSAVKEILIPLVTGRAAGGQFQTRAGLAS